MPRFKPVLLDKHPSKSLLLKYMQLTQGPRNNLLLKPKRLAKPPSKNMLLSRTRVRSKTTTPIHECGLTRHRPLSALRLNVPFSHKCKKRHRRSKPHLKNPKKCRKRQRRCRLS